MLAEVIVVNDQSFNVINSATFLMCLF